MLRATGLFSFLLILALTTAWFLFFRPLLLGGPASYIMVSGTSMEPTLAPGDLAILRRQAHYAIGDIVAYRAEGGIVIHRIVGGTPEDGFVLRGDNKALTDPWLPKPENIVGKLWFHVPGGGRLFSLIRTPLYLSGLVGGLTLFALLGESKVQRRRRGGRPMVARTSKRMSGRLPAPVGLMGVLGILACLSIGLAIGAILSFRQPTVKGQTVERLRYEHTASFDYTVQTARSSLYPSGVIGPVTARPPGSAAASPEPIYTKLARSLDLGFTYALKSDAAAELAGEVSTVITIQAGEKPGEGWTKIVPLEPPAVPFSGTATAVHIAVDFADILALIEAAEKETEYRYPVYQVAVVPTVRISGRIGSETVEERYAPAFTMRLTQAQIMPDQQLTRNEAKTVSETVWLPQSIRLLGLSLPVPLARLLTSLGAVLALIMTGLVAAVVFLGLGRDESAKIRARYGSMLVRVSAADLKEDRQRVQVTSIQELVRLAQRDGGIIFQQELGPTTYRYFVLEEAVTYEYQSGVG